MAKAKAVPVDVRTVHGPASELGYVQNFFADGSRVYAAGGSWTVTSQPLLLRSDDDGGSFKPLPYPGTTGLRDVYASGEDLWVVGDYGMVATSANGGATWKLLRKRGSGIFYCIVRDDDGVFWASGDGGLVLRSANGKTFRRVRVPTTTRVLRVYPDPLIKKRPWLVSSELYRFTNKAFELVPIGSARGKSKAVLTDLQRTATGALLLVGDAGAIFRSEDDGAKWTLSTNPAGKTIDLEAILITPFGILVVGDRGTLLASNDDGKTFMSIETSTKMQGHVWSVIAAGDGVLIGADQGGIYRLPTPDLAKIVVAAFEDRDATVAALAAAIRDGDAEAQVVLEDALRERALW